MESEDAQNEGNLDIEENPTIEEEQPEESQAEASQPEEARPAEAQPSPSMETLLEGDELSLDFPRAGEMRTGIVVSISDDQILVGIGTKSEGIIPRKDLDKLSPEEVEEFDVGQEIPVYVVTPEDSHGNLLLSYSLAIEESDWGEAEKLLESGDVYEGEITGYNKGGLIVNVGKLRGFVPGSQISLSRRMAYSGNTPDQRWGKMVGEPIATRVIEVDRERRRLILSERAALQEARELLKERLLDELEVGQVYTGRVTSLADFGAFVNIQGADGLVHLTEISWERINHPSEVLKVGQEVEVKVIDIDHDRKRIGLSIRQLQDDPWPEKVASLQVGQLVEGHIVRLVKFGAFARIGNLDIEGLIHISELSDTRIEHPKEVVSEGETLTLRVVNIDPKRHRVGLSLRKVDSPQYANLDWELALAEGLENLAEEEEEIETAAEELEEEIAAEAVEEVAEVEETAEEIEEEIAAETVEEVAEVEAAAEVLEEAIAVEAAEEVVEVEEAAEELEEAIVAEAAEEVAEVEERAEVLEEEIVEEAAEEVAEVEAAADEAVEDIIAEAAQEIQEAPDTEAVEEIVAEAAEKVAEVKEAADETVDEIIVEAGVEVAEVEDAAEVIEEAILTEAAEEVAEIEEATDEVVEEIIADAVEEVAEVEETAEELEKEIVVEAAEEIAEVEEDAEEVEDEILTEAAEEVIEAETAAEEAMAEEIGEVEAMEEAMEAAEDEADASDEETEPE